MTKVEVIEIADDPVEIAANKAVYAAGYSAYEAIRHSKLVGATGQAPSRTLYKKHQARWDEFMRGWAQAKKDAEAADTQWVTLYTNPELPREHEKENSFGQTED